MTKNCCFVLVSAIMRYFVSHSAIRSAYIVYVENVCHVITTQHNMAQFPDSLLAFILIGPSETKVRKCDPNTQVSFKKFILKMVSAKCQLFCSGLDVLYWWHVFRSWCLVFNDVWSWLGFGGFFATNQATCTSHTEVDWHHASPGDGVRWLSLCVQSRLFHGQGGNIRVRLSIKRKQMNVTLAWKVILFQRGWCWSFVYRRCMCAIQKLRSEL